MARFGRGEKTMLRYSISMAVIVIVALAGSAQAVMIFSDGVFNNSDWTLTTYNNATGPGSTAQAFQVLTGGNPNEYREIRHQLQVINPGNGGIFTFHMNNLSFYTPSSQGAISYIDYSEDDKNFINQGGNGQGSGLAIYQNGKFYRQQTPMLVMPYSPYSVWTNNSATGLLASSFAEVTPAGVVNLASFPDFSAAGTIMQLGFHRGNSGNSAYNTDTGIDNWRVTIVPEPSTLALLGLASVGLLGCAWLKRK
jgi:hypothetical protein